MNETDKNKINWLEGPQYQKAITQLRMQMNGIFDFLKVDEKLPVRYMYGTGDGIPGAISEAVNL